MKGRDAVTSNLVVGPKEQYGMLMEEESAIKGKTAKVEVEEVEEILEETLEEKTAFKECKELCIDEKQVDGRK
jgi:transposase